MSCAPWKINTYHMVRPKKKKETSPRFYLFHLRREDTLLYSDVHRMQVVRCIIKYCVKELIQYVHSNDHWAVEAIFGHLSHRPFAEPVGTGERLAVVLINVS